MKKIERFLKYIEPSLSSKQYEFLEEVVEELNEVESKIKEVDKLERALSQTELDNANLTIHFNLMREHAKQRMLHTKMNVYVKHDDPIRLRYEEVSRLYRKAQKTLCR